MFGMQLYFQKFHFFHNLPKIKYAFLPHHDPAVELPDSPSWKAHEFQGHKYINLGPLADMPVMCYFNVSNTFCVALRVSLEETS